MANYTVTTNFGAKDALATGNPSKTIKGSEFTTEFTNIATAISTKADSVNAEFTGTFTLNAVALTATAPELNTLDGITASTTELNYCDGVTSAIQTQLDSKLATATAASTYQTQAGMSSYLAKAGGTMTGDLVVAGAGATLKTPTSVWTLSGWNKAIDLADGYVVRWAASGGYSFAWGQSGANLYLAKSTADSGAAVTYPLSISGSTNTFTFNGPIAGVSSLGMSGALSGATTGGFSGNVTAADFIISSDARLKENVRRLEHTGYTIEHLNGYSFQFKASGKKSIGFIAQEVQQVLPELVHESEDGFLAVSYGQVVAVLVEEVKSLRARVFALEAR